MFSVWPPSCRSRGRKIRSDWTVKTEHEGWLSNPVYLQQPIVCFLSWGACCWADLNISSVQMCCCSSPITRMNYWAASEKPLIASTLLGDAVTKQRVSLPDFGLRGKHLRAAGYCYSPGSHRPSLWGHQGFACFWGPWCSAWPSYCEAVCIKRSG